MVYRAKKNSKQKKGHNHKKTDPPNQEVLDSIGSSNVWTPAKEDAWLQELNKIPAGEIYSRFPPLKKPPSVRRRGKGSGWGGNSA